MISNQNIQEEIQKFIREYTHMNIGGLVINCPYWVNRLKNGQVVLRGFGNGKGSAKEIRDELIKRLNGLSQEDSFKLTSENLRKFAKRERIGIDCSGLVYRVLDKLLHLGYGNTKNRNLDEVFYGGIFSKEINKTNVKRLTSPKYSFEIKNIKEMKLGDMIRLWGGKHAAIIIDNNQKEIIYAHSSWLSAKIQGVHTSSIQIVDPDKPLSEQKWIEETRTGENYGKKYFRFENGDSVFRLKIFS